MTETYTRHEYDVVVIGAGGAGLRAAIEAARSGAKTAIITKSLLGKAHTVMAEGGCAAALQNASSGVLSLTEPRNISSTSETLEGIPSRVLLTSEMPPVSKSFVHCKNEAFTKGLISSWSTPFATSSRKVTE